MKKTVFIALTLINISISASDGNTWKNWFAAHNPFAQDPLVQEGQKLANRTTDTHKKNSLQEMVNDLKFNTEDNLLKKFDFNTFSQKQRDHQFMADKFDNDRYYKIPNNEEKFKLQYHEIMRDRFSNVLKKREFDEISNKRTPEERAAQEWETIS